jgi:P2 family phage contractile tail tube protein
VAQLISVTTLWNCNVLLNGTDLLGRMAEFKIPQPKRVMVDYKSLGMAGQIEVPVGFEKLETTLKWTSFDADVLTNINNTNGMTALTFMADAQVIASTGLIQDLPVSGNMTVIFKDPGPIDLKAQANAEYSSVASVYHIDYSLAGQQILLFDSLSNQYVVNGVDQLAQYRANLGA